MSIPKLKFTINTFNAEDEAAIFEVVNKKTSDQAGEEVSNVFKLTSDGSGYLMNQKILTEEDTIYSEFNQTQIERLLAIIAVDEAENGAILRYRDDSFAWEVIPNAEDNTF